MSIRVHTGRTLGRSHRAGYCQGCDQRILLGAPKPTSTWPGRLHLEREQWELLLVAAAEYRDLSASCSKCDHMPHVDVCSVAVEGDICGCWKYEAIGFESAVSFVDWVGPDALRGQNSTVVEADGAPPRNNAGGLATRGDISAHRHPWPLPTAEWRPSRREG